MDKKRRYICIVLLVCMMWKSPILFPLRVLDDFFHQVSHIFFAILFGEGSKQIYIHYIQKDFVFLFSKGIFRDFMIVLGGYVGSVFWGSLFLLLGIFDAWKDKMFYGIGITLFFTSLFYGKTLSMTPLFSLLILLFSFMISKLQNEYLEEWVLDIVGITNIMYPFIEIFNNIGNQGKNISDIYQFENITRIPFYFWAGFWVWIDFIIFINCFHWVRNLQRKRKRI